MLKKEFTSFDVAAVVRELRETILDCRVTNVYQLDGKTLTLKLHKPDNPPLFVILEAGRRLHLTAYLMEKPLVPPAFCMALRKHLRSSILANVEQHEFERVVILTFKMKTGSVKLVLELFGDGNIILVDGQEKIQQALSFKRMRDRNIIRGESFLFAPSSGKNPLKMNEEEFRENLLTSDYVEIVRALARIFGIGGVYAEEVLLRAGVDKKKSFKTLEDGEIKRIFEELQSVLSQVITGSLEPRIVLDHSNIFVEVTPIKLKRYDDFKFKCFSSFNEALDEFYTGITAVEKTKSSTETDVLKREAERLERIVESQKKVLAEAEDRIAHEKRVGDLIYAHSGELQILLDRFTLAKEKGTKLSSVVSEVFAEKRAGLNPSIFFRSFDSETLLVSVVVDGCEFRLDMNKTLYENAAEFYERGKRTRQKAEGARTALEDSQRKLSEVRARISEAEKIEHVEPSEVMEELAKHKVERKEWFRKFHWFTSSDGSLVLGGKDATTNEILVKKYTKSSDVVFHSDVIGAPFVVVKTEGKEPSEQVLREAADFAAAFSRAWRENFGSVDVYWVKPEQLSKTGPSGEYVSHGGFAVTGKRNWMRNTPLRTAIGVIIGENGEIAFTGGPIDAVKAKTNSYAIIVPSEEKGKELFRNVFGALSRRLPKEYREKILKMSGEVIREFIPYGKGKVLES